MVKQLSLYWKCQLFGWPVFVILINVFNQAIYRDFIDFISTSISILIIGPLYTHLLKLVIKKLGILKKRFSTQIIQLTLLTGLFSAIGTLIWFGTMLKLGYWNIEGSFDDRQADPIKTYFFNLFPVLLTTAEWVLIYFLFHYVKGVRREERLKTQYRFKLLELEAKALRAQMNPHFIYNCLNSIKALIQTDEKLKATNYLTTFSKLIRTLFQNSDKRQISLYDEIETCKLYTQLECMRFGDKLKIQFQVDEDLDLKSMQVPALIIQPFIENAIWHGIVPKNEGGQILIRVYQRTDQIVCEVDDDGIGRELSAKNKPIEAATHVSKGVHLSQARLNLERSLNETSGSIKIIDKYEQEIATGTKVVITFNIY